MTKTLALTIALLLTCAASAAQFAKGNPATGKNLFDAAKCNACHVSLVGGDGSKLFTRPDRKINSADALLKQIRFCATQSGARWSSQDDEHVAAYLNQQYYKFQ